MWDVGTNAYINVKKDEPSSNMQEFELLGPPLCRDMENI